MTLIYFDGFQDVASARKPEFSSPSGSAFTVTTGRDNSTNGGFQNASSGAYYQILPATSLASSVAGFGFEPGGNNPFGNVNGFLYAIGSSATNYIGLGLTTTGFIEARRFSGAGAYSTGTVIGTSSGHDPILLNIWRHLQVKLTQHPSTGSLEVKLDTVSVLTLTGANTGTSASSTFVWLSGNPSSGYGNNSMVWDDFWLCDQVDATATQGRPNNDFLGDLTVKTLIPSANGTNTAWSKSTGTNAALLVDEVPPNTTDYIFSSTSAQKETMALGDLPASANTVYGLRVNFYGAKSDAGASSVKPAIRESGGTYTAQTAKPLSTTFIGYSGEFLWTKPSASTTPFTVSDVNALEAGVELA